MKTSIISKALIGLTAAAFVLQASAAPGEGGKAGNKGKPKGPQFAQLDSDANGSITVEEFTASRLKGAEKRFAKNGDGADQVAKRMANFKKRLNDTFAKADADDSGELSKEEFKKVSMGGGKKGGKKKKDT